MQEESETISDFIRRTDYLANRLGLNLSETPQVLGISKAMLYGYRSGKNRITAKIWLKLADAEKHAGIHAESDLGKSASSGVFAGYKANPKDHEPPKWAESSTMLRDDRDDCGQCRTMPTVRTHAEKIALIERTIDGITAQLQMVKDLLQTMKEGL